MSPSFTSEERSDIRKSLMETGYALFTTQGLKKTTLEELTAPSGVHKTSFYSFFGSKEELYLELLLEEGPRVQARLDGLLVPGPACSESLRSLLTGVVRELENNPLVRRLITHPEELEAVARRVRPEDVAAKTASLLPLQEFVQQAQSKGCLIDAPPEVVVGVIRAVTMATLHRRDIGEAIYSDVIELLILSVSRGLAHPN